MSEDVVEKQVEVSNALGLHTRPATLIVKLLQGYTSAVSFTHEGQTIDARSILNILMLAAQKGTVITITATGDDAKEVVEKLVELFDTQFGEDAHV